MSGYTIPEQDQVVQIFKDVWNAEKKTLIEPATPEQEEVFLKRGEAYIDRYYRTKAPFDQARPWGFEQRISYQLDEDTNLSGIIDRLDSKDDTIYITDYKTNQRLYPDDKDVHEEQLLLYGLAVQQMYGKKFSHIVGRVIYLHLEKEHLIEITNERMEALKQHIQETITEIKQKATLYSWWLWDTAAFAYTTGDHCKYCAFEIVCPAWKHKYAQDEVLPTDLGERSLRAMIDQYGVLKAKKKEIEEEEKSLAAVLSQFVQTREEARFFWDDYILYTRKYEKPIIADADKLFQEMKEKWVLDVYTKPDDSALLKGYKAGEIPVEIRDLISIDTKKILMWTRPRTKTGDEEDEEDES